MAIKVNAKVAGVAESMTLSLAARAQSMRAEGIDVISFAAGEPDFITPEAIRNRAVQDIHAGVTRYTAVHGTPELRRAICEKLKRDNDLDYSPDQVIVSSGGKHSLYNIFQTMLEEGDEVLLPCPYWLSYPEQIRLAGGKTVVLPATAATNFKISPEQLAAAITPRTVAFLFNSPCNPTGAAYTPEEIRALAEVLEPHPGVTVISDEIYEKLIYGGLTQLSFAAASPAMKERTLTVNSMSKTYAMTGWRIGYCAGPVDFIKAMSRLQSQVTSNPTSFCQSASITALSDVEDEVETMREAFDERRKVILAGLKAIPGVLCPEPMGAFYVFPDVSALYRGTGVDGSIGFCEFLLKEARVVCVPGLPFGEDRSIRISYATSLENLREGLGRISSVVSSPS